MTTPTSDRRPSAHKRCPYQPRSRFAKLMKRAQQSNGRSNRPHLQTSDTTTMDNKRIVLVSGARGGIGDALVDDLLRQGHSVIAADIAPAAAAEGHVTHQNKVITETDVTSAQSCAAAVAVALANFGRLDALVNIAGVCYGGDPITTQDEHWQKTFDINVRGMFLLSQAALPALAACCSRADVINVSSIWGVLGNPNLLAYSASKFAVEGYTAGLREYGLPRNIRVGSIQVDKVDTGFRRHLGTQGEFPPARLRRMLTPKDVSAAILFMLHTGDTAMVSSMRLDAPLWSQPE